PDHRRRRTSPITSGTPGFMRLPGRPGSRPRLSRTRRAERGALSMTWFIILLAYVAAHFGLYALVLRRLPRFIEERVIFAYHAVSAVVLTVLAPGLWLVGVIDFATLVGLVSLHGLYSMSFLELWSLSQGGYSLQILDLIERSEAAGAPVAFAALCD